MATLEKIRSKGTLLLIVVGLALAAFIIGDFLNSAAPSAASQEMAVINGEELDAQAYMTSLDEMQEVYQMETGNTSLPEETINQIRESVWETTLRNSVIGAEAEEIGMRITHDEFNDLITGDNISSIISSRRMFMNENGVFDKNQLANFINVLKSEGDSQIDPVQKEELKQYWNFWLKLVKTNRLEEKYTNLISKAMVVTPLEAKYAFDAKQKSYDVVFAMKNYFAIPDSTIAVSESEIKTRYNKVKGQYKHEVANANIKYVTFDIKPSSDDFAKVERDINSYKAEFATTSDIAYFTNSKSDLPYAGINLSKEDIDVDFADFALSAAKDSVMGPIFVDNTYKMARIVETDINLPDSVKLRNIAIAADNAENTKIKADSIMDVLNAGGNFEMLASQYSVAQNAKVGGEIGWVRELDMPKSITEKAFAAQANTYFQVEEGGAINIFKVEELGAVVPKVKLAIIALEVIPSSRTQAALYGQAKQFAGDAQNQLSLLESNAKEQNLQVFEAKNVNINANVVNNVKHAREVVRWTFENDVNSVSDVIECEGKLLVAAIVERNEKGYKAIDQVRDILVSEVRKDKKAEQLADEMSGKTIDELRGMGYNVDTVRNINFASAYAGSVGSEPVMFGTVGLSKELSTPAKGKMGVFVYKVINTVDNPVQFNEAEEVAMMTERQRYQITNLIVETLKTAAEVEDFRYKFF